MLVFLPSLLAWIASLGVMCVFLYAYDIPISFHTLMRICGGNSIANVTSVTPGGAGVTQAFNVASLNGITSAANATAYSVAQQLVTTAWNIVFAIIMMAWAFGWSGGESLVRSSYTDAKVKAAEQSGRPQGAEGSEEGRRGRGVGRRSRFTEPLRPPNLARILTEWNREPRCTCPDSQCRRS